MGTIIERLRAGQLVRVMHFTGLSSPKLVEVAGILGDFHGLWIDQEHTAVPHAQLELMLMACRAVGLDAFARVRADRLCHGDATDGGGLQRRDDRSSPHAGRSASRRWPGPSIRRGVCAACSAPRSRRGMATIEMRQHTETANRERWVAIQIETTEAVEIIDEIAVVEGVDHLFVGPADLSVNLGVPGEFMHAKCIAALERVAAASKRTGKSWGILSKDPEHVRKCRELGCQLFSVFGDLECFRAGLKSLEERFKDIMD